MAAAVAAVLVAAVIGVAFAGRARGAGPAFQYVAKYVCSNEVGPASTAVVSQGTGVTYRTAVNIHNPNSLDANIAKKAAVALSERSTQGGVIGTLHPLVLKPDQALLIDCKDIATLLGGVQPNGDGVVVIYSDSPLDVWAAYTMRGTLVPAGGGAPTAINGGMDVVHVDPSQFTP